MSLAHPGVVYPYMGTVAGRVALWGRVIEHDHGYRAQYGYPLALWLAPTPGATSARTVRALAARYGVPTEPQPCV